MGNIAQPAVFLDRDGVLSKEKSYVCSIEDLEIFPYVEDCIKRIHEKGYYALVVTNQSGIARGLFTEETLQDMNQYLIEQTCVDAVYYCPHHIQGIVPKYSVSCQCRKPQTGLIKQACKDFSIDLSQSIFVGDRASDILTGQKAGLKTVLLESGYGRVRLEKAVQPDYLMQDLRDILPLCE